MHCWPPRRTGPSSRAPQRSAFGAAAPFYLWPGCDVAHVEALCLFESFGYWPVGAEVNMSCPTRFRSDPPSGVAIVRALDDEVIARGLALVRPRWPGWVAEMSRAVEQGCCHVAISDTDPADAPALGFACHSVNRAGWIGPMGTDPTRQHGGVGSALLGQLCRDLQAAEFARGRDRLGRAGELLREGGRREGVAGVPLAHAAAARCTSLSSR